MVNKLYPWLCHTSNLTPPAVFQCENWNTQQVVEWLKGIDDGIEAYIRHFVTFDINGSKLINIDSDALKTMGINKETTRAKIISAINLLVYYSYTIKFENLQKLALNTSLASNELLNAVSQATPVIKNSSSVLKHIDVLNGVLAAMANTYETSIKLISWLERNPYIGNRKFTKLRNNLISTIGEMLDCVNNPSNPKFFSVPQILVERAHAIRRICNEIIYMNDPSVLYTAFLERVTISRPASVNWEFEVGRTCFGLNLITRVDYNSPAAFSDKFDVGDEILEIDNTPVVGWKHSNILNRLNAKLITRPSAHQFPSALSGNIDLQLLLSKRPRENGSLQRPPKIQVDNKENEAKNLTKLAMDFKNKIGTDMSRRWKPQTNSNEDNNHMTIRRIHSSNFTIIASADGRRCSDCSLQQTNRHISLLMPTVKHQLFRRASVWNESPPATLRSPFEGFHSGSNSWLLLLASWGVENRTRILEKSESIQSKSLPQDDIKYAGISVLIEDGFNEENDSINVKNLIDPQSIVFSDIRIVNDVELASLGTVIIDHDWNAPIKEITGLQPQRNASYNIDHSTSGVSMIDSPLSNIHAKIARFFYGDLSPTNLNINTNIHFNIGMADTATAGQTKFVPANKQLTTECRTPITPKSKYSLDLMLSTSSTKPDEENSSYCSVDSPSSYSTIVKTISNRHRLAPLAEPDEIDDFTSPFIHEIIENVEHQINDASNYFWIPAHDRSNFIWEGWIRREILSSEFKRQRIRASFHHKRWKKSWVVIRERILYIYTNEKSSQADIVINLESCALTEKPELKTSKKYIFLLKCDNDETKLHFITYSDDELNSWIEKILPLVGDSLHSCSNNKRILNEPAIVFRHN